MAKKDKPMQDQVTETAEAPVEAAPAAVPAAPKVDKRHKKITVPAPDAEDGTPQTRDVNRTDFIRELWAGRTMTRAQIRDYLANKCTSVDGSHDVVYQIIFAATKDLDGGPTEAQLAAVKAAKEAEKKAAADAKEAAKAAAKAAATPVAASATAPVAAPASTEDDLAAE